MKNAPGPVIVDQLRSGDFLDRARICRSAFRGYEKVLLALAWVSPVIAYPFTLVTKIPLALIVATTLVLTAIGLKHASSSLRST